MLCVRDGQCLGDFSRTHRERCLGCGDGAEGQEDRGGVSLLLRIRKMSTSGPPPNPLRALASAAGFLLGGLFTVSFASSVAMRAIQSASESKRKKIAPPCVVCKGKGFHGCKLCKGNSTIEWSPLYDPIAINPCLCPTCDGNRVQRCLNCLGKGYV